MIIKTIKKKCGTAISLWITFYKKAKKKVNLSFSKIKVRKYKNLYAGRRCFIIGNGPSLKTEDLEKLKNDITFGCHGIFYIFDKTDWRPTFYCAQDSKIINKDYKTIKKRCNRIKQFYAFADIYYYPFISLKSICLNLIRKPYDKDPPAFSEDLEIGTVEGFTVTYMMIQLAAYMGFKEIYLLGIDHHYEGGEKDHFSKEDICINPPLLDKSTLAYVAARRYCEKNDIRIYNSTRGGYLEVFERKSLDFLFNEQENLQI